MIESFFSWTFFSTFNIPRFHLDIWGGSPGVEAKNRVLFCIYECRFWHFRFQQWIRFRRTGMYCCTVQRPFSGGAILLMATFCKMSLLAFLACCVWRRSKTTWSWAMAPPCPWFDRLGQIICSSVTQPKLKILWDFLTYILMTGHHFLWFFVPFWCVSWTIQVLQQLCRAWWWKKKN